MAQAGHSTHAGTATNHRSRDSRLDAPAFAGRSDVNKSTLSNLKTASLLVGSLSDASNGTCITDKARQAELLGPWVQGRRNISSDVYTNSKVERRGWPDPVGSGDGADAYHTPGDRSSGGFDHPPARGSHHPTSSLGTSMVSMDDGSGATKVRKPYTITKQRERWTDDEHTLFLEALKEHGRQWVKIAEHIGTKTAVQIRSHAQKFFSRVEKEKQSAAGSSGKSTFDDIRIPPPRPKRKPSHPYPRKAPVAASGARSSGPPAQGQDPSRAPAERSVAAVAAAASAAAAAAAAAVVAAAGEQVQAQLLASPPTGFPFFGRTPADLELQAQHAVHNPNMLGYFAKPTRPASHVNGLMAAKRSMKEAAVKTRDHRLTKRAKSSGESGELVVRSDGDSACSGEDASPSEQGGYADDFSKAEFHTWKQARRDSPRQTGLAAAPMPSHNRMTAASAAKIAWEQAAQQNQYLEATGLGPAELHAWLQRARQGHGSEASNTGAEDIPRQMQAYLAGFPPAFPRRHLNRALNSQLHSPANDPCNRYETTAPSGMLAEPTMDGKNGSGSGSSVVKNSLLPQKDQRASGSKEKSRTGGYDGWSPDETADGSPESGEDVREPTSPSVHEAGQKGPSNTTGSGSDTVGSGQKGSGDAVQPKEASGPVPTKGSNQGNKARPSGGPSACTNWYASGGDATAMTNRDNGGGSGSQNGSGGNGGNGSGGSNVGNGIGRSSDEERSSCELRAAHAKSGAQPSADAGGANPYRHYEDDDCRYASQMMTHQERQQQNQHLAAAALQHAQSPWLHYSPAALAQLQHAYSHGSMGRLAAAQRDSAFMQWSVAGYNMQRYLAAMNNYSTASSLAPQHRGPSPEVSRGRDIESASPPPRYSNWRVSGEEGHTNSKRSRAAESPETRLTGS